MSLINDALKRAKQAQQPHSPDAPQLRVQFRPVEPAQQVKKSHTGIWIAIILVVGLIGGFAIRQMTRGNSAVPKEAKAREIVVANPLPQATPAPQRAPAPIPAARPTPVPAATTPAPPVAKPVLQQEPMAKETPAAASPVIVQEEPAATTPPKLQALVYNPKRPSAIISGKSVFEGDRIGEFRVAAITQESVTLVGAGQTNILVLGE